MGAVMRLGKTRVKAGRPVKADGDSEQVSVSRDSGKGLDYGYVMKVQPSVNTCFKNIAYFIVAHTHQVKRKINMARTRITTQQNQHLKSIQSSPCLH